MACEDIVREAMSTPPSADYVREKAKNGWRLVAVEWARPKVTGGVDAGDRDAGQIREEIPYGLRVADDCRHLEENPIEKQAMLAMLAMIVDDKPLSQTADSLNREGFRTRDGREWTQTAIFYMMPRIIQIAPQLFSSEEWRQRRAEVTARLAQFVG